MDSDESSNPPDETRPLSSDNESSKGPQSPASGRSSSQSSSDRSRSQSPQPVHLNRSHSSSDSAKSPAQTPRSPQHPDGPQSPAYLNPRSPSPAHSYASSPERGEGFRKQENGFRNSVSPAKSESVKSEKSGSSVSSKRGRRDANLDDGNTSDSSASSGGRSRKNKTAAPVKNLDVQPEAISDGDMDSDHDNDTDSDTESKKKEPPKIPTNINITHEDLSDVSDLDDSIGAHSDEEALEKQAFELRQQIEEIRKPDSDAPKATEKPTRAEEGEEQLDFEAEDGECAEIEVAKEKKDDSKEATAKESGEIDDEAKDEAKQKEELEEGEVTDEDDVRPEETEPRPVCRFFSRGQCTWGASCRFLHPGVTDKGNYTMFEMIRPVIPGEYGREERMYGRPEPPPLESAWERGLRTAKEMLRKSIKRKEQDIDFEEKKMNLSLAQEELDKENGYYGRVPSPEPRYVSVRHPPVPVDYPPVVRPPPEEYYGRRQVLYDPEYMPPPPRERVRTFRELPPHRMPDYYNNKYEDEAVPASKVKRPKREVIVQRVEERQARADEWSDPWMRSKSPQGRKGGRKRSYSSGSSYTSSSSSGSTRSSYKSRSRSPHKAHRSPRSRRTRQAVSPSVIVSERKAASERAALMNPPAPKKKAVSPGMMRAGAQNPPAPSKTDQFGRTRSKLAVAAALARVKGRQRSSRSSSGSSGSSSSDSDSSDSSSSSSRGGSPPRRSSGVADIAMALKAKAIDALKGGNAEKRQIKLNLKNPLGVRKPDLADLRKGEGSQGKKRAVSPQVLDPKSAANKKATSRREELLKQLKAVEDAIAKKRSKVN